jgi:type 1 fimbria pilin
MKSFMKNTVMALAMIALVSLGVFAAGKDKVKKDTVTLLSDVTVNGTLLKAGTYEIRFDEKTGELAIVRDGKIKAKTTVRSEERSDKAQTTAVRTDRKNNIAELIGVTFAGSNQNLVVSGNSGAVSGSQH